MSKKLLKLKIITPEKVIYEDEVESVSVPTTSGQIGVFADHMPLVSVLKTGEIRLTKPENPEPVVLSISHGVVEVRPSSENEKHQTKVVVLAIRSEFSHEIDISRAEESHKRAEQAMKEKENITDAEFASLQGMLDKELNRIKVAKRWRK
jgi:F-type H+-transporting ATPase subunit epsilon